MSSKPWYPRYPRDFRAKTMHLDLTERGAYNSLLDHYYELKHSLPCDPDALYRIAGAFKAEERAAVDRVSREFFSNGDGKLTNARAEEEIAKMRARSEQQSELAKRRWEGNAKAYAKAKPKRSQGNAKAYAKAKPKRSQGNASHSHSHILQSQSKSEESKPLASSDKESLSAVARIPLIGGKEYGVTAQYLAELETAYPAVDGPGTLREIRAWCVSNPEHCKTERGVTRFLNRWFERVQNRG